MSVHIVQTASGAAPDTFEITQIQGLIARYGRVTLLVGSSSERDLCRRALADAGCGLGVDVATPAAWIASLWELMGDGRHLCTNVQRQLLMAHVVAARSEAELLPLRANPGTVRMLARMARDLLPAVVSAQAPAPTSDAEAVVRSLLTAYGAALDARALVEPSAAAELLASAIASSAPACARAVAVRDVTTLPGYLVRLLAAVGTQGSVSLLLRGLQASWAPELAHAFALLGCTVEEGSEIEAAGADAGSGAARERPAGATAAHPTFLEVAGPHARARAYADEIARMAGELPAAASHTVAVASARPAELFDALAPYLAARGLAASTVRFTRFADTRSGSCFITLSDLVARMKADEEGRGSASAWWPAPELTDWLYAPASGADASFARGFDKKVRSNRALGVQGVLREVQSVQSRIASARKKLDAGHPYAQVPAVCADVLQFIWQDRPVSALKSMLAAVNAQPASAFGSHDGRARQMAERAMLERALEVLTTEAHALGVSQAVAVTVLEGLCVSSRVALTGAAGGAAEDAADAAPSAAAGAVGGDDGAGATAEAVAGGDTAPAVPVTVRFMTLADAALLQPGEVGAVFLADVDVASYPLSHEEGPLATLAAALDRAPLALEPAARLRDQVARALTSSVGPAVLARVTHDRQAKDRYPAAIWTELRAALGDAAQVQTVGEGDLVDDFDPAGAQAATCRRVACQDPQQLSPAAVPYLVLKGLTEDGRLMPRQFSASQIEAYASCPLCWFVSSRVRPARLDAGFTNMEMGNFVHDVMDRFHQRLIDEGLRRVTTENLDGALACLDEVFEEVRAEHARGKTASSAPLVPLSATERRQVGDILPQLRKVVRYEAQALAPFAPAYLEYSFNGLGVEYAGWPLGGRIDRVDVDAEGRAVVIDYKHRSDANPFKLKDPTMPLKKTGAVPADDPRWLPEHTQTLIYGQALRRALGLTVRGALYFSTKGRVAMRGAVAAELAEVEPGDGRVPGLRDGFPAEESGGTMGFDALLDRVEAGIAERLDELRAGVVTASDEPQTSCFHNHPLGFTRREA